MAPTLSHLMAWKVWKSVRAKGELEDRLGSSELMQNNGHSHDYLFAHCELCRKVCLAFSSELEKDYLGRPVFIIAASDSPEGKHLIIVPKGKAVRQEYALIKEELESAYPQKKLYYLIVGSPSWLSNKPSGS